METKQTILEEFDKWFNLSTSAWDTGEDIMILNNKPIGMTIRKGGKEIDRWFPDLKSQTKEFLSKALDEQREEMIKEIEQMPEIFPEMESDEYDEGFGIAKREIIKRIKKL